MINSEKEILLEALTHLVKNKLPFTATDLSRYSQHRGRKIVHSSIKGQLQALYSSGNMLNYKQELYKGKSYVDWAYLPNNLSIEEYTPLNTSDILELELPIEVKSPDKEGRLVIPTNMLKQVALTPNSKYYWTKSDKWLRIGLFGLMNGGVVSARGELRLPQSLLQTADLIGMEIEIVCLADCIELYPHIQYSE